MMNSKPKTFPSRGSREGMEQGRPRYGMLDFLMLARIMAFTSHRSHPPQTVPLSMHLIFSFRREKEKLPIDADRCTARNPWET